MNRIILRLLNLIRKGELRFMIKGISKRIWSTTKAFGLKRDLSIAFQAPEAQIKMSIRSIKPSDVPYFNSDLQNDGLVAQNIPTCYVALNDAQEPCYRQWLMGAEQNAQIQTFWGKAFPVLKADEALVESVFTIPKFRTLGIMSSAMDRIALKAKDFGARYVMLFVEIDNIPSLKGCDRSGFLPFVLRTETWRVFKRHIRFETIPELEMENYYKNIQKLIL